MTYVRMKQNRCRKAGIASRHVPLPATTTIAELVGTLRELSADPAVHGILPQHPVGDHIDVGVPPRERSRACCSWPGTRP